MNQEELTPHVEELERVLKDKVDKATIIAELDKYVNNFGVDINSAKAAIKKKCGISDGTSSFVTGNAISKKIGELQGTEMNVDITAKAIYVDKKEITVRGSNKVIVTGIIGDETGTSPFTIWEGTDVNLEKGTVYLFKNAYTKLWNNRVQINLGSRGKVEETDGIRVDVPERTISMETTEMKIGEIREGVGNITVTGRILSVETRNINVKGEDKVVYSGLMADDTGKIQFSAWKDFELKEGESICAKNAYVRAWKGIPQVNMGDRCEVSRIDDSFGEIDTTVTEKTVAEIVKVGGGLDLAVTGTVVDMRAGSGLIKRCPQCNRSVLNDECTTHGHIEPVSDLRMKLIIDDGTGALSAIVNRQDTEKITGVTLAAAEGLAKARGDSEAVARDMVNMIIMKKLTVTGNVMSDEYGPSMIVRSAEIKEVDVIAEAESLLKEVEGAL